MRNRRCVLLVLAACAAVGSSAMWVATGSAGTNSNSSTYSDPVGDPLSHRPAVPDVSTVVVSNDDAGVVTFQITVANQPTFEPQADIFVEFDADQNASTGIYGYDYYMNARRDGSGPPVFAFCRVGIGRSDCTNQSASFSAAYPAGSSMLTFNFDRSAIRTPGAFNFRVLTTGPSGFFTPAFDSAPDKGSWAYQIIAPPALPPPPAADTEAPHVKALASAGFLGAKVTLRYQVSDNSGQAREQIGVYSGPYRFSRVIATRLGPLTTGHVYSVKWKAPKVGKPGDARFCVEAFDRAGNTSEVSCRGLPLS